MINMQHPAAFFNLPMSFLALAVTLYMFFSSAGVQAADQQMQFKDVTDACYASLRSSNATLQPCIHALTSLPEQSLESARVFSVMALVHARERNLVAARKAMDTALSLTVDDVVVQGNLGSLLIAESDFHGAVLAFNGALALATEQTTQAALYLNRSLALRAMGRYDEAAKDFELYLTLGGLNPIPTSIGTTQVQLVREPLESKNFAPGSALEQN